MLNSESYKSERKEISPEFQERIRLFTLVQRSGTGNNPRASAHRERHKSTAPLISIAGVPDNPRNVQQHHKEKKHYAQHRGRCSRKHFCDDTDRCSKERHANEVGPEQPPRHERRHQCCHESAINKMLHPENNQRNGHEDSSGCFGPVGHGRAVSRPYSIRNPQESTRVKPRAGQAFVYLLLRSLSSAFSALNCFFIPAEMSPPFSETPASAHQEQAHVPRWERSISSTAEWPSPFPPKSLPDRADRGRPARSVSAP